MRSVIVGSIVVLLVSNSIGTSQVGFYRPQQRSTAAKSYDDLWRSANGGDRSAAWLLGYAYETHQIHAKQMSDIDASLYWYRVAISKGELHAIYRMGLLLKSQVVMSVDANGRSYPDVKRGQEMMEYAVQNGLNPDTGAIRSTSSQNASTARSGSDDGLTSGALLFGLGVLGVLALASSTPQSEPSTNSANSESKRKCPEYRQWVPAGLGYAGHWEWTTGSCID